MSAWKVAIPAPWNTPTTRTGKTNRQFTRILWQKHLKISSSKLHPQLLGTWCKNLVKTSTSSYDGETVTWEYTLDSDGYVSSVKRTDRDYYSYEYRWE